MKEIIVDCTAVRCAKQFHRVLAEKLGFPEWYGGNLDALYDCLTDLRENTCLTLKGFDTLGDFGNGFRETIVDAAGENPHFSVRFTE